MTNLPGRSWYRAHLRRLTDCELYESTRRVLTVELLEMRELPASDDHWFEWQDRHRVDMWHAALAAARQEVWEHAESNRRTLEELRARCPRRDQHEGEVR